MHTNMEGDIDRMPYRVHQNGETTSIFYVLLGFSRHKHISVHRRSHLYINIPTQKELPRSKQYLEVSRCAWIGELVFGNLMK